MSKRIFWGVFLVLAAAYWVVSALGYLPQIGIFSLIFTIACIGLIVVSLPKLSFGGILFPLAFICIIYDKQLNITALTPWIVLGVALLGTIGLSLIFSPLKKKMRKSKGDDFFDKHFHGMHINMSDNDNKEKKADSADVNGENIWLTAKFNGLIRYIKSHNLKYVMLKSRFSGCKVYFDSAQVPSGNVTLELDTKFSGVEIYVPKTWNVIDNADHSFGSIEFKGEPNSSESDVVMNIVGKNDFGGVEIKYI